MNLVFYCCTETDLVSAEEMEKKEREPGQIEEQGEEQHEKESDEIEKEEKITHKERNGT